MIRSRRAHLWCWHKLWWRQPEAQQPRSAPEPAARKRPWSRSPEARTPGSTQSRPPGWGRGRTEPACWFPEPSRLPGCRSPGGHGAGRWLWWSKEDKITWSQVTITAGTFKMKRLFQSHSDLLPGIGTKVQQGAPALQNPLGTRAYFLSRQKNQWQFYVCPLNSLVSASEVITSAALLD